MQRFYLLLVSVILPNFLRVEHILFGLFFEVVGLTGPVVLIVDLVHLFFVVLDFLFYLKAFLFQFLFITRLLALFVQLAHLQILALFSSNFGDFLSSLVVEDLPDLSLDSFIYAFLNLT